MTKLTDLLAYEQPEHDVRDRPRGVNRTAPLRPTSGCARGTDEGNLVETSASDEQPGGLGVADRVIDSSCRVALCGHDVELRQPRMVDGLRRCDEFFGPCDG